MKRQLCIAIDDVSLSTWPQCERLHDTLSTLGRLQVTLAVGLDFHGGGRGDHYVSFIRAVDDCGTDE